MDKLESKRKRIENTIERVETFLNSIANQPRIELSELKVRESMLVKAFDEFCAVQDQIEDLVENDADKKKIEAKKKETVEEKYIIAHSTIKSLIELHENAKKAQIPPPVIQVVNPAGTSQQLPITQSSKCFGLKIPFFSGNYGDWHTFYDLFMASVDKDPTAADSQKLLHLKTLLKNEPLSLISELNATDANYRRALDILKERYDKKMPVVNYHINMILQATALKGMQSLRNFLSQVKQHINALEALQVEVHGKWDLLLINIFSSKIERNLRNDFELGRDQSKLPDLKEFLDFLDRRVIAWESSQNLNVRFNDSSQKNTSSHAGTANNNFECIYCKIKGHTIFKCTKFGSLNLQQRRDFVSNNRLCFNCLNKGHGVSTCNREKCRTCSGKHNFLLHDNSRTKGKSDESTHVSTEEEEESFQTATCIEQTSLNSCTRNQVLLATSKVTLVCENGRKSVVRGLLDSGSQTSFVTRSVVEKLHAKGFSSNLKVSGIGQSNSKVSKMINLKIVSNREPNKSFVVTCGILDKITCDLPQQKINISEFVIPPNIDLADPEFDSPGKIDLLIGADLYFELIDPGIIRLGSEMPILQNSKLGWIVGGKVHFEQKELVSNFSVSLFSENVLDINELIPKFWQLEEVSEKRGMSIDDKKAEDIFSKTTTKNSQNRFVVNLPLKGEMCDLNLGESFSFAKSRFLSLEKRLHRDSHLFEQYKSFIDEYLELKHASLVELSTETKNSLKKYFLPHHCVIREEAVTTKLRVVFDASMKTSSGASLNDVMLKGPTVQSELFDIVCRFRTFKFVFTTDLVKMYRQVLINPDHRHLQNILWRDEPDDDLKCIQLDTVTYGTNCAPFLATRCIVQLANEHSSSHPRAANTLLKQTYVDDILGGANTLEEFASLKEELIEILNSAGFSLHKWVYNVNLDDVENVSHLKEIHVDQNLNKVLGISWIAEIDNFSICGFEIDQNIVPTKRFVLANIAKLFDPLGFIGPLIILGKMLMQKVWSAKIDWDSYLTDDLIDDWKKFARNIAKLKGLQIPRLLYSSTKEVKNFEIHAFSDASLKAYGTCIYLRTIYFDGDITCRLICAKSRVAPKKIITLPRLELCGFLLMARLCQKLVSLFGIRFSKVVLWTDSEIVLGWLKQDPSRWVTFVSNRVSEIQELTNKFEWCHVSSNNNPADHISRGLDTEALINCDDWWNGPKFLYSLNIDLTGNICHDSDEDFLPEKRVVSHVNVNIYSEAMQMFSSFSKFRTLQRSLAWCLRFVNNSLQNRQKITGPLTIDELNNSLKVIIRCIQCHHFSEEMEVLKNKKFITSGPLVQLNPFLDQHGVLRVHGRLAQSELSFSQKFPIILPPKNHVVNLIFMQEHTDLHHAGPQMVLANLRLRFWPVNGLSSIKKQIKSCLTCFRFRATSAQQLMGSLPLDRVSISRPFLKVGVDFGGPFILRETTLRKSRTYKAYIALFVCMVTKAIHLELVTSLSSDAFLATLKRFIARRGHSHVIYSDNGTNFQGANNSLKEVYEFFKDNRNKIIDFLSGKQIRWKFIPPNSPHWGGLWEAGIKSTKFHLKRIVGSQVLTFEQFSTFLCQIEAILNSRPLTAMSTDPSDLNSLTPSHFLIGDVLTSFPEKDYTEVADNRLTVWQNIQKMRHMFWKRWSVDYLNKLQNRPKWFHPVKNLSVDDMVLVKEDGLNPLDWRLGRVVEIMHGQDKKVRVVKIRTKDGVYCRPITKLCPLPFSSIAGEDVGKPQEN